MKNYLFPKFFNDLSAEELVEYCLEIGIDGPTLLIRDGYWVEPDNFFDSMHDFLKVCRSRGFDVEYADTPFDMKRINEFDNELAAMSANGIKYCRVNYIAKSNYPARSLHDKLCMDMEKMQNAACKHKIKAIVQLHGGMYPHNATAAYFACKNFNSKYIGIKLDQGNHIAWEGYEEIEYQIDLLQEYVAAIGEKDARLICDGDKNASHKGWRREFVPTNKGFCDYEKIFAAVKRAGLSIPGILMPFYYEQNRNALREAFKDEVAYIKRCQEINGL